MEGLNPKRQFVIGDKVHLDRARLVAPARSVKLGRKLMLAAG